MTSTAASRPTLTVRCRNRSGPSRRWAAPVRVISASIVDALVTRLVVVLAMAFDFRHRLLPGRGRSLVAVAATLFQLVEFGLHLAPEFVDLLQLVLAHLFAQAAQARQRGHGGDICRACPGLERLLGQRDELQQQVEHGLLAGRRAVAVGLGERGLAQEAVVHQLGVQQRHLMHRRQRVLADDPRHPLQALLLLEQHQHTLALAVPVRVALALPPAGEFDRVLGIGVQRVHRRVETGLGPLPVQRPEAAHVALGVHGHRFGEVAGGRAHGADDGHRAFLAAQRLHPRGPLVEVRQTGAEIGRVAGLRRQLAEAAGDLPQGLGPAAGGVGHERHVPALVAEILGHGDARVDARLPRRHRHVRRIGNDDRTLHERPAGAGVLQLRQLVQHLGHLVAPLAAADIDDDIGIAPLGERLLQDGLAGAEPPREHAAPATGDGEQGVEDALAGDQRRAYRQPLRHRARPAHGPVLTEANLYAVAAVAPVGLDAAHHVLETVLAGFRHLGDAAARPRRHQAFDRMGLLARPPDALSGFHFVAGGDGRVEGVAARLRTLRRHAGPHEQLVLVAEGAQQPVEYLPEQMGTEADAERPARALDAVAGFQSGGAFVDLGGEDIAPQLYDLAEQLVGADVDGLLHVEGLLHARAQHRPADPLYGRDTHDDAPPPDPSWPSSPSGPSARA